MTNKATRKLASCPNPVDTLRTRLMRLALDSNLTRSELTAIVAVASQHGLCRLANITKANNSQLRNEIFRIAATELSASSQQIRQAVNAARLVRAAKQKLVTKGK